MFRKGNMKGGMKMMDIINWNKYFLSLIAAFLFVVLPVLTVIAGEPADFGETAGILSPKGVASVGNSGLAMTSISIEVPPGRNGITPTLSINYSSGAKNGWIGLGWSLDMGSIERNTKLGVDYSSDDYIAIVNGSSSELVQRDDWCSGSNKCYGAKIESGFLKYQHIVIGNNDQWIVTTKDGTKYFYGSESISNSKLADPADSSRIFKWFLDRVEDTNGNYMTVTYWHDTNRNQIYLDRIDYTGNTAGLAPSNYVKFYRESRNDISLVNNAGFPVKTAYRLKSIDVWGNGSRARAYKLSYNPSGNTLRSCLSKVEQYGNDADVQDGNVTGINVLPAIEFGWQGASNVFSSKQNITNEYGMSSGKWSIEYRIFHSGDFNGDGMTDLLTQPDDGADSALLLIADGNGGFQPAQDVTNAFGMNWSMWDSDFRQLYLGDFNGDGMTDILAQAGINGSSDTLLLIADGSGGFHTVRNITNEYGMSSGKWSIEYRRLHLGDFNGDGMTDLLAQPDDGADSALLLIADGNGGFQPAQDVTNAFGMNWSMWDSDFRQLYLGDFNGDGMTDILAQAGINGSSDTLLLIADGSGGFHTVRNITNEYGMSSGKWSIEYRRLHLGDFNGDGMTDLLARPVEGANSALLLIADGNGGFQTAQDVTNEYGMNLSLWYGMVRNPDWPSSPYPPVFIRLSHFGDFNGDGMTDILLVGSYMFDGAYLLIADGSGGFQTVKTVTNAYGMNNTYWAPLMLGDFDGNGKIDLLSKCGVMHDNVFLIRATEPAEDLLNSVTSELGGSTTMEYTPSSHYDNKLLPFNVQTLSRVEINDGNGHTTTTTYNYSGGNFNFTDRGYWGFEYITATAQNGTYTKTKFENEDYVYKGVALNSETRDLLNNLYSRSVNTYNSTSPYTGVNFPFLASKLDEVYDGTGTPKQTQTDFEYDQYGNVTRNNSLGDLAVAGDEKVVYTVYNYDTSNWILALPSTSYVQNSSSITKAQSWYTYEQGTSNLITETQWCNTCTSDPVTAYTYDTYGNVVTIVDPNHNQPTIMTYDSVTNTYPVAVQNPLGHTLTKTYDYRFGKVLAETGPNNNTTTYEYDVFGRILNVYSPLDSINPTMKYEYPTNATYGQVGVQKVKTFALKEYGTGNYIWSEGYFDGFGRTIKTRSEGPESKVVVTETNYNDMGQIVAKSFPYFAGFETARFTFYEYDPMGRVIRTTYPDATSSTGNYSKGRITLIDANGHKKAEEKDVYGRTVKVEEYTGTSGSYTLYATTRYEYDLHGNLTKTIDVKGNQTIINYDSLSRKISMTDPDMGHWTYAYDANGNLTAQTDAKLQTIEFQHDALNRVILKDYPTGTDITYDYDEGFYTNSIGRLTTLTDKSGITKFYYNELGQSIKTEKTIDTTVYTTETTYDALGRTETITYPDTSIVNYTYDSGGNLDQVIDDATGMPYATYSNYNALGQVGETLFGNGVSTIYQYHPDNNRLYSITTNNASGLINKKYVYDNVGNIKKIEDLLYPDHSRDSSYIYDELDRLKGAINQYYFNGALVYDYDKIGNMTQNCKYGFYKYEDTDHKHAVTRIENHGANVANYAYDANGNMLSGADRTFTYDYDNMPETITYGGTAVINVYDANGQRVKKITPTATTTYLGQGYECDQYGSCTKYIFAGSQRIASIKTSGTDTDTYFYHTDHLGSSTIITAGDDVAGKQAGDMLEDIFYYPYGEIKSNTGSVNVKHKFTGHEYDAENGLIYAGARYYDPKLARFITADTIVQAYNDPQSLNRYSYTRNNPIIFKDPSGHCFIIDDIIIGAVIGAVIGGASSAVTGGDIGQGMLLGAVTGAFMGGAAGLVHVADITSSVVESGIYTAAGAGAGATNASIMGGDIGLGALYGGLSSMAFGAISNHYGGEWGFDRVLAHGATGGVLSELQGGSFVDGFITSGAPALAMSGWTYAKNITNESSIKGSGPEVYNERGELQTFGLRKPVGDSSSYLPGGGKPEGSTGFLYGNRQANFGSKSHDFLMLPLYKGTGNYIAGGKFYNTVADIYNITTMPLAAVYTGFAFSADMYNPTIYDPGKNGYWK